MPRRSSGSTVKVAQSVSQNSLVAVNGNAPTLASLQTRTVLSNDVLSARSVLGTMAMSRSQQSMRGANYPKTEYAVCRSRSDSIVCTASSFSSIQNKFIHCSEEEIKPNRLSSFRRQARSTDSLDLDSGSDSRDIKLGIVFGYKHTMQRKASSVKPQELFETIDSSPMAGWSSEPNESQRQKSSAVCLRPSPVISKGTKKTGPRSKKINQRETKALLEPKVAPKSKGVNTRKRKIEKLTTTETSTQTEFGVTCTTSADNSAEIFPLEVQPKIRVDEQLIEMKDELCFLTEKELECADEASLYGLKSLLHFLTPHQTHCLFRIHKVRQKDDMMYLNLSQLHKMGIRKPEIILALMQVAFGVDAPKWQDSSNQSPASENKRKKNDSVEHAMDEDNDSVNLVIDEDYKMGSTQSDGDITHLGIQESEKALALESQNYLENKFTEMLKEVTEIADKVHEKILIIKDQNLEPKDKFEKLCPLYELLKEQEKRIETLWQALLTPSEETVTVHSPNGNRLTDENCLQDHENKKEKSNILQMENENKSMAQTEHFTPQTDETYLPFDILECTLGDEEEFIAPGAAPSGDVLDMENVYHVALKKKAFTLEVVAEEARESENYELSTNESVIGQEANNTNEYNSNASLAIVEDKGDANVSANFRTNLNDTDRANADVQLKEDNYAKNGENVACPTLNSKTCVAKGQNMEISVQDKSAECIATTPHSLFHNTLSPRKSPHLHSEIQQSDISPKVEKELFKPRRLRISKTSYTPIEDSRKKTKRNIYRSKNTKNDAKTQFHSHEKCQQAVILSKRYFKNKSRSEPQQSSDEDISRHKATSPKVPPVVLFKNENVEMCMQVLHSDENDCHDNSSKCSYTEEPNADTSDSTGTLGEDYKVDAALCKSNKSNDLKDSFIASTTLDPRCRVSYGDISTFLSNPVVHIPKLKLPVKLKLTSINDAAPNNNTDSTRKRKILETTEDLKPIESILSNIKDNNATVELCEEDINLECVQKNVTISQNVFENMLRNISEEVTTTHCRISSASFNDNDLIEPDLHKFNDSNEIAQKSSTTNTFDSNADVHAKVDIDQQQPPQYPMSNTFDVNHKPGSLSEVSQPHRDKNNTLRSGEDASKDLHEPNGSIEEVITYPYQCHKLPSHTVPCLITFENNLGQVAPIASPTYGDDTISSPSPIVTEDIDGRMTYPPIPYRLIEVDVSRNVSNKPIDINKLMRTNHLDPRIFRSHGKNTGITNLPMSARAATVTGAAASFSASFSHDPRNRIPHGDSQYPLNPALPQPDEKAVVSYNTNLRSMAAASLEPDIEKNPTKIIYNRLQLSQWYQNLMSTMKMQINQTVSQLLRAIANFQSERQYNANAVFDIFKMNCAGEILEILSNLGLMVNVDGTITEETQLPAYNSHPRILPHQHGATAMQQTGGVNSATYSFIQQVLTQSAQCTALGTASGSAYNAATGSINTPFVSCYVEPLKPLREQINCGHMSPCAARREICVGNSLAGGCNGAGSTCSVTKGCGCSINTTCMSHHNHHSQHQRQQSQWSVLDHSSDSQYEGIDCNNERQFRKPFNSNDSLPRPSHYQRYNSNSRYPKPSLFSDSNALSPSGSSPPSSPPRGNGRGMSRGRGGGFGRFNKEYMRGGYGSSRQSSSWPSEKGERKSNNQKFNHGNYNSNYTKSPSRTSTTNSPRRSPSPSSLSKRNETAGSPVLNSPPRQQQQSHPASADEENWD